MTNQEFDVLKFKNVDNSKYDNGLEEAKRQQSMLTAELQRLGIVKMVADSLPDQSWRWGADNPRFTNGNWDVSSRIVVYRDFPTNKGASIRGMEAIYVVFDPRKVLTISGQVIVFSGPIPEEYNMLSEVVNSSVRGAYSNSERKLVHINFISSLLRNPKPTP